MISLTILLSETCSCFIIFYFVMFYFIFNEDKDVLKLETEQSGKLRKKQSEYLVSKLEGLFMFYRNGGHVLAAVRSALPMKTI